MEPRRDSPSPTPAVSGICARRGVITTAGMDDRRFDPPKEPSAEWSNMVAGLLYDPGDAYLVSQRRHARRLSGLYNNTGPDETLRRSRIVEELFGAVGAGFEIEPPFYCDYGCNIMAGTRLYMNFGCVILDCARVELGDRVLIGPNVQIYTAHHPADPALRSAGRELAASVTIGDGVWIGGGAIICPGVRIGDGSTIGAGSVVTRDVPPGVVAAGNPCRVLRAARAEDR